MTNGEKSVAGALVLLIVMCFTIVTLGGYVRLTNSGLSIPEWPFFTIEKIEQPDGSIARKQALFPPTDDASWETLRQIYLTEIPADNSAYIPNVTLAQFKTMFWIEWAHRGVAKTIGAIYLIFLALVFYFPETRKRLWPMAVGGLILLVSQAVIGAIVVFEHLRAEKVALHLTVAFLYTSLLLWMLLSLVHKPAENPISWKKNPLLPLSIGVYVIVMLQIFSGGLMAGAEAGYMFNTWPKMGDYWVPPNMMFEEWSFARNMLENKIVIQFTHRWFAFIALGAVLFLVLRSMTLKVSGTARWALRFVFAVCLFQLVLGILTLLLGVHPHVALTHQSIGLVLALNLLVIVYEAHSQPVLSEVAIAEMEEKNSPVPAPTKEALT